MIIWLASYPKSGNTLLRSMLSAYFYSKDGIFHFELLKNIKQFPDQKLFKNLGIDTDNELNVVKNYVKVQEEINKRDGKSVRFLKTHSSLNDINGHKFTNLENTLGAIHIVRDPRDIMRSYANQASISEEEAKNRILEIITIGGKKDKKNKTVIHTGSWLTNYISWKQFKKTNKYLLMRFEDLTSEPEKNFLTILEFVHKLSNLKLTIDKNKLKNVLRTTSFEYLKNLEEKSGFDESYSTAEEAYVQFFKYGNKKNVISSEDELNNDLKNKLSQQMRELGYL